MKKSILGTLLGGAVLFVWGMVSWTFLPWHDKVMGRLPNEQLVMDVLKANETKKGVYFFPSDRTETGRMDMKEYQEKFKDAPSGLIVYSPLMCAMSARHFVVSIARCLVLAFLTLWLLGMVGERVPTYFGRVMVVTSMELVVWFAVDLPYWNWFGFPLGYTIVSLLDGFVGFFLLGIVSAKFACKRES